MVIHGTRIEKSTDAQCPMARSKYGRKGEEQWGSELVRPIVRAVAITISWLLRHWFARLFLKPLAAGGDPHARLWFDPQTRESLEELQDAIRSAAPENGVVKGRSGCVVTSAKHARRLLSQPEKFKSLVPTAMLPSWLGSIYAWSSSHSYADPFEAPSIVAIDGSRLVEARKLLRRSISGASLAELRIHIAAKSEALCHALRGGPTVIDVVENYSRGLSREVMALAFDVPVAEMREVCSLAESASRLLNLGYSLSESFELAGVVDRIDKWTVNHLEMMEMHPKSIIAPAVQAMRGGRFSDDEVHRMVNLMLVAGFTTTVAVLSSGIKLLIENPDQLATLDNDPKLWPNAVEEILRIAGPVMMVPRLATCPVRVGDMQISAGRPVYVTGANRDPHEFVNPHRFDVTRANAAAHLSFGGGTHLCLGAPLARVEIEVGLRTFFSRFAGATILGSRASDSLLVRSWDTLTVALPE